MITSIFIYLAGAIMAIVALAFSKANIDLPYQITDAVAQAFSALNNFQSVFPVSDAVLGMLFLFAIYYRVYLIKIIFWVFAHLPFIGRGTGDLPSGPSAVDLRETRGDDHTVDLRGGRYKQKYRTMEDIRRMK